MTSNLWKKHIEYAQKIKDSFPEAPVKLALVLDCWSAPRREGYIAIKVYWIADSWTLKEALLGFEPVFGKHSGKSLGCVVWKLLETFELLGRIIAITTDNASNNKTLLEAVNSAIRWLNIKLNLNLISEISHIPCLAHVIQLAVQQLLFKIRISPANSQVKKDWIEEEEMAVLKASRSQIIYGNAADQVSIFYILVVFW